MPVIDMPVVDVVASDKPADAAIESKRVRRRGRVIAYPLLALLFTASVAALVVTILQRPDTVGPANGDDAVAAARTQALNIMTLDYRTAKRDLQRVVDGSVGLMRDQYGKALTSGVTTASSTRSVSTGTILSVGLSSLKGPKAEVLVAGDATVAFPKSATSAASKVAVHYRFRFEMENQNGTWKSAQLNFAGLPSYSQVAS